MCKHNAYFVDQGFVDTQEIQNELEEVKHRFRFTIKDDRYVSKQKSH